MPVQTKSTTKNGATHRRPAREHAAKGTHALAERHLRLHAAAPSFTVNDLEKSLTWYTEVLGFTVKERWESEGALRGAELSAGSVHFYVGQDDGKRGHDRAKGEGFRIYCSTTQDVDRLAEAIEDRGGELLEKPHDEPWGGRALSVMDPDGFKITISKE